jgi:hypothetical protein
VVRAKARDIGSLEQIAQVQRLINYSLYEFLETFVYHSSSAAKKKRFLEDI